MVNGEWRIANGEWRMANRTPATAAAIAGVPYPFFACRQRKRGVRLIASPSLATYPIFMRTRFSALVVLLITVYALAQSGDTPAYHAQPPAKGQSLPAVLTEAQLADRGIPAPAVVAAYRAAAKAPSAL